jgi:coenzyme F420-reducing hydrogenase delta subunit
MNRMCSTHGGKKFACKFWRETVKDEDHVGGSRHRWDDNIKWILKKCVGRMRTGFI